MKERRASAAVALSRAKCTAALELALEPLREAARGHGYALALHGSVARDIDLVAIPWVEDAAEPEALTDTLLGVLRGIFGKGHMGDWANKPHGRRARILFAFADQYVDFDLSVMPRVPPPVAAAAKRRPARRAIAIKG